MTYQDIQTKIENYIPQDKCIHFIVGFFLAILSLHFLSNMQSIILVTIISLIKEIRDKIVRNNFDWKDLIATILPTLILTLTK